MVLRERDYAWGGLGGGGMIHTFVYGARISLLVGLLSAGIGISLGLVVGLPCRCLGRFVMRF